MRKRITAFIVLLIAALVFTACTTNGGGGITAPPVPIGVNVSGDTLGWSASAGADSYTVSVNGQEVKNITALSVNLKSAGFIGFLAEGANTLKVKAVKGDKSSAYSDTVSYTYTIPEVKLAAPVISISSAEKNRVQWAEVANASGYKVNIDGTDLPGKVSNCYYDFMLNVETASIKVKAMGTGKFTDSDYSNVIEYTNDAPQIVKLDKPQLTLDKKTVSWDEVPFAEYYQVSVDGGTYERAESPFTLTATATGTYDIKVKAIGDGVLYGDSDAAQIDIVIEKIVDPVLTVLGRSVSWEAAPNAVKYQAKINGGEYADAVSPFELPQDCVAGSYTVTVKAIGNGQNTLDSGEIISQAIVIVKLDTPTGLAYSGNRLSWTGNATKYKITVSKDGGAKQEFESSVAYRDFNYTAAGVYTFQVTAIATDSLQIDSDESAVCTKTIAEKVKLGTPANAVINGNTFTWDNVANAEGYIVEIKKNGILLKTEEASVCSYTFTETDLGVYSLRVKAVTTDSENYVESDFSSAVAKTVSGQLAAPVVSIDDTIKNKIIWDAIPNAESYEIYVNGIKQATNVTGTAYTVTPAAGSWTVKIKAVSSSAIYGKSEFSNEETVAIVKLLITNVTVSGRTVSFTAPVGAVRVEYQINGGEWTAAEESSVTVTAAAGTYSVRLRAIGDGQIYLNGDETERVVTVTKLATPTLTIDASDKRKVVWGSTENAIFKVSTDNENFTLNNSFNYVFNETVAGVYTLYVLAEGISDNYLASETAVITVTFTKLAAPTGLSYNETTGILSWTGTGAKFVIAVDLNGTITTDESVGNSYNPGLSAAGTYSITVTAKGGDKITLDSDASDALSITVTTETPKLLTPVVTLTEKTLSWGKVENAESYTIELLGTTNYTFIVSGGEEESYSYVLGTTPINAGKYTVKVCAETTAAGFVKSDYWTASFTQSNTLANTVILVSGKTVSWTAVPNALSYKLFKEESGNKTLIEDNIMGLSYTFTNLAAPFIGTLYVVAVGDGEIYLDSETAKTDVTLTVKLSAPTITRDDDNRKFTIETATGVKDIFYTYTAKGTAAGVDLKYVDGIPYGDAAGEFILSIYYTGNTGYEKSDKTTETYTVLAKLENIVINRDKISFDAVAGVEKYIIKDNDGVFKDFAVDEGLAGGMHRFYISAASNVAHTLPGVAKYYTVLVISNVAEFNLIVNSYEKDAQGNGANNLWGTSTLINDIPDTTGMIKTVVNGAVDYNGVFLGNGFTIGKTVPLAGSEGLFGHNRGKIENLTLYVNANLTVDYVGGIAKDNLFRVSSGAVVKGELRNIKIYGTVKGKGNVGGLVGANVGDIFDCINYATVTGTSDKVGGIAGDNKNLTITEKSNVGYINRCVNSGAVTGVSNVGGIVGSLSVNAVDGALNKGRVTSSADGWGIGGIAGITLENAQVFESMNTGEIGVTGKGYNVGGIIGKHGTDSSGYKNAAMFSCINTGKVNTANPGENSGGILTGMSYVWKKPTDTETPPASKWDIKGGILNCAYLEATEGATVVIGVNKNTGGTSDSEMKKMNLTFTEAQADALCAALNAKSLSSSPAFKTAARGGGNFYVVVAWCENYL